jgi:translation elongation factor EF-Tu-like GTPase
MSENPEIPKVRVPFRMVITDIYVIKARGIVVVGNADKGAFKFKKSQPVFLIGQDKAVRAVITGVHLNPSNKDFGVLLKGVRREDIVVGMVITTEGI